MKINFFDYFKVITDKVIRLGNSLVLLICLLIFIFIFFMLFLLRILAWTLGTNVSRTKQS